MIITPAMKRARSEGRWALVAVVASSSRGTVAERLGVSPSVVSHWCAGRARPAARLREAMHAAFGIEPAAWGRPTEHWTRRPAYRREELGILTMRHVASLAGVHENTVRSHLDARARGGDARVRVELALAALGLGCSASDETIERVRKRARVSASSVRRYLSHGHLPAQQRTRVERAIEACLVEAARARPARRVEESRIQ